MSGGPVVTLFEVGERLMRGAAYLVIAFVGAVVLAIVGGALVGCAPARVVTKPAPIEVTKYVYKPLPAEITRACEVKPADPACSRNGKPELCNDQLLYERNAYRAELAGCDADKTEIRKLQPKDGATP